jgi:hypothetical protein
VKSQGTKKSPLKERPFRNPGKSLDGEIQRVIGEEGMPSVLASLVTVVLAGLEWWRFTHLSPPNPWVFTILAVLVVGYSIFRTSTRHRR